MIFGYGRNVSAPEAVVAFDADLWSSVPRCGQPVEECEMSGNVIIGFVTMAVCVTI